MKLSDELSALERRVRQADAEEAADLVGHLHRLAALCQIRLHENGHSRAGNHHRDDQSLDRYLSAQMVAQRIGMSTDWVYRHRDELGGVKSGGAVRFPERAVARYLKGLNR